MSTHASGTAHESYEMFALSTDASELSTNSSGPHAAPSSQSSVLETERLLLREIVPSDLDDLARIYANPIVMRGIGSGETKSRQQTKDEIDWTMAQYFEGHPCLWATIRRTDGCLIGRCGLLRWDAPWGNELEVAYLIDQRWWNRGYATEAAIAIRDYGFTLKATDHLVSFVYPDNHRSARVAQKMGMTYWRDHELAKGLKANVFRVDRKA